jgi:hypothetical protein
LLSLKEKFRLGAGGGNQSRYLKVATRKERIDNTAAGKRSLKGPGSNYWTDWIITTPTVKAIMTPTIITLEACWVMRVTDVTIEIPSMAAIKAAGAITKGISLVNQMSVCIFFFLVMIDAVPGTG